MAVFALVDCNNFFVSCERADLEEGRGHADAEGLGLLRAGDHAAVVVGQHDDRAPLELGASPASSSVMLPDKVGTVGSPVKAPCPNGDWPR